MGVRGATSSTTGEHPVRSERCNGHPTRSAARIDEQLSRTFFQDPQPSPETPSAEVEGKKDEPFLQRLFEALFEEEPTGQGEAAQPRRLPPAPYQSPPFPFAEHLGPIVGIRDDAVWPLMETLVQGYQTDKKQRSAVSVGSGMRPLPPKMQPGGYTAFGEPMQGIASLP